MTNSAEDLTRPGLRFAGPANFDVYFDVYLMFSSMGLICLIFYLIWFSILFIFYF